jgi:hypothetical protein
MNKQDLLAMKKDDLLELLNKSYVNNPDVVLKLFDYDSFDSICAECYGQTSQKRSGDEGWTVCSCCSMVEGKTYEIDNISDLGVCFNYNQNNWMITPDNLGEEL